MSQIKPKTKQEVDLLRRIGQIHAEILTKLYQAAEPGVAVAELDSLAGQWLQEVGMESAFLNYLPMGALRPFPSVICVSVNQEIVHGVAGESDYTLMAGDLVSIDLGLKYQGLITDAAFTKGLEPDLMDPDKELLRANREALRQAVNRVKAGRRIGCIGEAVEEVAEKTGFSIVKHLAGHGVGYAVHEAPFVPNTGRADQGPVMPAGAVLAIEPMLSRGSDEISLSADGYTYSTEDGSNSAHFEQTVLVTKEGVEILTPLPC